MAPLGRSSRIHGTIGAYLEAPLNHSVLFVCRANLIRSPIGMVLLRAKVETINENPLWRIGSVGTWTENGIPIIQTVEEALASVGLDAKGHYSRIVTREIMASFQLILVMERGQKEALQIEFPDHAVRTYMLSEMIWLQEDVPDPKDRSLPGIQNTIGLINYYIDQGWNRIYNLSKEIIPIEPSSSAPNFR